MSAIDLAGWPVFDSHMHIIDPRFALVENEGYLPPAFTVADYRKRMAGYDLRGGVVVSGSFQGFDQQYLVDALHRLGPGFVGVTQLPDTVSDQRIRSLARHGVVGLRFNLRRGAAISPSAMASMAARVHAVAGWHIELYVNSTDLGRLADTLVHLPAVSIDHLGLSQSGLPAVTRLLEAGVRVKATGFGRLDFPVAETLRALHSANPHGLMFGTDLPSTRASRAYADTDFGLVVDTLGAAAAADVLYRNAARFYARAPA